MASQWVGVTTVNNRADVALLHELFHAVSASLGLITARQLFNQDAPFTNSDEFYAMLVENIYCSEVGLRLRGSRTRIPRVPRDHERFYERHAHLIIDFCRDYPAISRSLSALPTNFNPLRQYYRDTFGLVPSSNRALRNRR